jgi:ribosomal protein L33
MKRVPQATSGTHCAVVERSRWRRSCSAVTEPGKLYLNKYCRHEGIILRRGSCSLWRARRSWRTWLNVCRVDQNRFSNEANISTDAQHVAAREDGY